MNDVRVKKIEEECKLVFQNTGWQNLPSEKQSELVQFAYAEDYAFKLLVEPANEIGRVEEYGMFGNLRDCIAFMKSRLPSDSADAYRIRKYRYRPVAVAPHSSELTLDSKFKFVRLQNLSSSQ